MSTPLLVTLILLGAALLAWFVIGVAAVANAAKNSRHVEGLEAEDAEVRGWNRKCPPRWKGGGDR